MHGMASGRMPHVANFIIDLVSNGQRCQPWLLVVLYVEYANGLRSTYVEWKSEWKVDCENLGHFGFY